jgi:hypothetical protein
MRLRWLTVLAVGVLGCVAANAANPVEALSEALYSGVPRGAVEPTQIADEIPDALLCNSF